MHQFLLITIRIKKMYTKMKQIPVTEPRNTRRQSLEIFRRSRRASEPLLYPGLQTKSTDEVKTNLYQLFYGDKAPDLDDDNVPDGTNRNRQADNSGIAKFH